jgi:hypothetical protein
MLKLTSLLTPPKAIFKIKLTAFTMSSGFAGPAERHDGPSETSPRKRPAGSPLSGLNYNTYDRENMLADVSGSVSR